MIEIFDQLAKLDLKDILGYVIESEKAARAFYLDLAKSAPGLAAIRLENLAREEEKHEKTVREVYKTKFGEKSYTVPKELPPLESSAKVTTVNSLIHALETAMHNEDNAYRVYTYLSNKDKENQKLWKYLASMEKTHYDIVKTEKESYEAQVVESSYLIDKTPGELWMAMYRFPPT
ncbi:MAG: ferritin family protein [Candidatus Methanofastidiosia archaeon]